MLLTIELTSKCLQIRRMVSLQSFEQFDVISMVDKRTENGKLLYHCFLHFAISTFPIMHLICPPIKILHKHCFQFLLGRL